MQNSPGSTSYIWKIFCPFSNPQNIQSHSPAYVEWLWWIVEAQTLNGAFGTWCPKLPSARVLLLRAQSGRERPLLAHLRNHSRRTSTEEMETIQWTQAQVEHNYARSAYTEQGLPLLRSENSKVLWKDGMQCNFNFNAILTMLPKHNLQIKSFLQHKHIRWNIPSCQEKSKCVVLRTIYTYL